MDRDGDDLARRLLDAHVRFQVEQLRGDGFAAIVAEEVDAALSLAATLTLDDVVDRADVRTVAIKYVAGFRLPGAIPELAGDIALRVRAHPAGEAPIADVLPRRHVGALLAKLAEVQPVRARFAAALADAPSVQLWLADFLHSLTTSTVAANRRFAERLPGVSAALAVGDRLAGGAVGQADRAAREVAERAARGLLHRLRDAVSQPVDDDTVTAWLLVWDDLAERSVGDALASVPEDDLVDLLAIGYELWLELRENPYLHALVGVGIDYFFDTYGGYPLDALLEEFGLGRADLVEEAMRFAPRVIAALDERGALDAVVRRRLAAFYESDAFRAAVTESESPTV
ncbi:hypothetical protein [Jatrophihabitans fulvus]